MVRAALLVVVAGLLSARPGVKVTPKAAGASASTPAGQGK